MEKTSSPAAWGGLLGAGLGAMAANEGEGMQGALLGGIGGAYGAHKLLGGRSALPTKPQLALPRGALITPPPQQAPAAPVQSARPPNAPPPRAAPPMSPVSRYNPVMDAGPVVEGRTVQACYAFGRMKAALEYGVGYGARGPSVNVSPEREYRERLPGMHRWVPRDVLERTFEAQERGTPHQDIIEAEGDRGNIMRPITGAALGALAAKLLAPGNTSALAAGGLGGAGLGQAATMLGKNKRYEDAAEALYGVENARRNETHHSAREAPPLTVPTNVDG